MTRSGRMSPSLTLRVTWNLQVLRFSLQAQRVDSEPDLPSRGPKFGDQFDIANLFVDSELELQCFPFRRDVPSSLFSIGLTQNASPRHFLFRRQCPRHPSTGSLRETCKFPCPAATCVARTQCNVHWVRRGLNKLCPRRLIRLPRSPRLRIRTRFANRPVAAFHFRRILAVLGPAVHSAASGFPPVRPDVLSTL